MSSIKPYFILALGVISVSFAATFIRLAEAPPLVIATYRLVIASAVLMPVTLLRKSGLPKRLSRSDVLLILLSSMFVALHFALWITSLSYTSIASSVVIVTSHPIFVAIISYFLWGERLNKIAILGIATALGGVILINYGGFILSSKAIVGDILALLAAISMGVYLIIGRQLKDRVSLMPYLSIIYTGAAAILLLVTISYGYSLFGYSGNTYLMFFLLALIPQLIGHSSLNLAVRLMPVTLVSVGILGEPVIAIALGYIILGEGITINEVIGGLLTLSGIFLVLLYKPKPEILRL
jgi:drug/metabolite transporter (DMT)-like permease